MRRILRMLKDRSGAAAAEFALIAAIAGAALTFAALALNTSISQSLDNSSDCVAGTINAPSDC